MSDVTRELILEAIASVDRSIAAPNPLDVPAPDFIEAMSDRQLCEWDLAVYKLALEALDARDALGAAWLTSGRTLAEGIRDKTAWLEKLLADDAREDG